MKNFLTFAGEHEFVFPDSGLFAVKGQIQGRPENSNGAGKSSFWEALAYTLDYASRPATEMQNWFNEDPFYVELTLNISGEDFKIRRSKNSYEVYFQDKLYRAAEAKDIIKKELLDSWLLNFITYRMQGVFGNFLSLSNGDRLDFLIKVLELNKFDKVIDESDAKIKMLKVGIDLNKSHIDGDEALFTNNLKFLAMLDSSLMNKMTELANINSVTLTEPTRVQYFDQNKINIYETDIRSIKSNSQDNSESIVFLDGKINEFNLQNATLKMQISTIEKELIKANSTMCKQAITDVWKKKSSLEKGLCSECGQPYFGHLNQIQDYDNELNQLARVSLPFLEKKEQSLEALKKEKEIVESKLNEFNKEKNRLILSSSDKDIQLKQKELDIYVADCNSKFERAYLNYQLQLKHNIDRQKALGTEIADVEHKLQIVKTEQNGLTDKILKVKKNIEDLNSQLLLEQEVHNVLGKHNFILLILEQILTQISASATDILQSIPNAIEYSVLLDTEAENKKGTIKKLINLKIFKNGIERSFKSLSGGQQCSVNLAIDAAIARMLSERASKNFGWIIFDESLNGLDAPSKLEAINTLKNLFPDKLTMVVEHSLEVNESLNGEILINNNKGCSSFLNT